MHISDAGGRTVATDLVSMFASVDAALMEAAQLAGSIMQMNATSVIPPAHLQPALDSAAAGFVKFVQGRKDMVQMHRKLAWIKGESNQRETDWGCWRLVEETFFAQDSSVPAAEDLAQVQA